MRVPFQNALIVQAVRLRAAYLEPMHTRIARRAAWLAMLLLGSTSLAAQDKGGLPARIQHYLGPFVLTRNLSGVVLVARHNRLLYQKGYGLADPAFGVPVTPRTRFHIASISKAFTAAAILLLADRGALRVSDPVSRFLPDYPNGDKLRLEHLLLHNSGIANGEEFPELGAGLSYTAERVVATFREKPLDFEPGTRFRYSNSDYNLLALIIEKVSAQSYGDFLQANLLAPLGLAATSHDGDARRVIPRLASGTEPDGLTGVRYVPYQAWATKVGSGSLVATATDLCRFATALFSGRLLHPASLDTLLHARGVFPYGWTDRQRAGRKVKASGGRSPGFISNVEYFLDDGTCVAILTNSYSSVGQVIAADLSAIVAGQSVAPPPIGYVPPRPGELAAFTGRFQLPDNYYDPGAVLSIRDQGDYLAADWARGFTSVIYPAGGDDFVDRTNWAMVHFTRDADGRITGFRYRLLEDFTGRKLPP